MPFRIIKPGGSGRPKKAEPDVSARPSSRGRPAPSDAGAMPLPEDENDDDEGAFSPPEEDDYTVGYGRPPRHTQFQKGKSGNPGGRRKGSLGLNTLILKNLQPLVGVRTEGVVRQISRIEAIILKQVELAVQGDPRAAAQLLTRYAAAVPEQFDHESEAAGTSPLTAGEEQILQYLFGKAAAPSDSDPIESDEDER